MHMGTGFALVGLIILMYHKIHDCKEDIGVSDYNRLRIQHIRNTFGYRIKGPDALHECFSIIRTIHYK